MANNELGITYAPECIQIRVERRPFRRNVLELMILSADARSICTSMVMKTPENPAMEPDNVQTLYLVPNHAQQLMDELYMVGVRPTEGEGSAGAMAAIKLHLDDTKRTLEIERARVDLLMKSRPVPAVLEQQQDSRQQEVVTQLRSELGSVKRGLMVIADRFEPFPGHGLDDKVGRLLARHRELVDQEHAIQKVAGKWFDEVHDDNDPPHLNGLQWVEKLTQVQASNITLVANQTTMVKQLRDHDLGKEGDDLPTLVTAAIKVILDYRKKANQA